MSSLEEPLSLAEPEQVGLGLCYIRVLARHYAQGLVVEVMTRSSCQVVGTVGHFTTSLIAMGYAYIYVRA